MPVLLHATGMSLCVKSLLQNDILNYIFDRILVSENVKWF